MVLHVKYFSIYREPVGMDVEYRHEYRKLDAAGVEIFVFESLFERHNLTVGRGYDHSVGIALELAARRPEEIKHEQIDDRRHRGECDGDGQRAYEKPCRYVDYQQYEEENNE